MQIFVKTPAHGRMAIFVKKLDPAYYISEWWNANLCEDTCPWGVQILVKTLDGVYYIFVWQNTDLHQDTCPAVLYIKVVECRSSS